MSKSKVLNQIIDLTRKTGQGLSVTLMRKAAPEMAETIDELIADGKLETYTQRYSYMDDDQWVVPKGCYFAIRDDENVSGALTFVRVYLGIYEPFMGATLNDLLRGATFMTEYSKWLVKNEKALIDMVNMTDVDEEDEATELSDEIIEWVKTRGWYTDNNVVSECLSKSKGFFDDGVNKEILVRQKQLLKLYEGDDRYNEDAEKLRKEMEEDAKEVKYRTKFNKWLSEQNQTVKIQSIL